MRIIWTILDTLVSWIYTKGLHRANRNRRKGNKK